MKKFTDRSGNTWRVEMDAQAIARVLDLMGIDLRAECDPGRQASRANCFERFAENAPEFVNMLYCICKPQADAIGMTDLAFGRAIAGEGVLAAATDTVLAESVRLFPHRKQRTTMKRLLKHIEG
jgi:hypothetical protein